jgi:hypothetical protein
MEHAVRGAAFWFSARQLLWATLFVLATGILLLIPLFIGPTRVPASFTNGFRSLHSAASVVLVVGTLGHGVSRWVRSPMTRRATTSGVLAATIVGLAAVSGAMATAPEWWAARTGTGPDTIEDWSSVFHFGYSAAMLVALVFWHVRPTGPALWPRANGATIALAALIAAGGLATLSEASPSLLGRILVPALTVWAGWTVILPQLLWLGLLRSPRPLGTPSKPSP